LRGGDVVGDHTVFFFGQGERIEITHRAPRAKFLPRRCPRSRSGCTAAAPAFSTCATCWD